MNILAKKKTSPVKRTAKDKLMYVKKELAALPVFSYAGTASYYHFQVSSHGRSADRF